MSRLDRVLIARAGRGIADKLDQLRRALRKANSAGIVVSMLDEVAWLFNLRGSDIIYNPVSSNPVDALSCADRFCRYSSRTQSSHQPIVPSTYGKNRPTSKSSCTSRRTTSPSSPTTRSGTTSPRWAKPSRSRLRVIPSPRKQRKRWKISCERSTTAMVKSWSDRIRVGQSLSLWAR